MKIGFTVEDKTEQKIIETTYAALHMPVEPRKSVVQVYFPGRNMTLAYYNNQFDLHTGDERVKKCCRTWSRILCRK